MKRSEQVMLIRRKADAIRRRDLTMIARAKVGHPGGDLSAAEILATLYFAVLRVDANDPSGAGRDRFILSKGHGSGALYATLAEAGFFPQEWLDTFMQPLSKLNGHPNRNQVPGVETNTGALGHGLPVAVGAALAAKMSGGEWRVYVLTGDGELQEGSNWEALMAASHYHLDNLVVIVDRNRLQQGDGTEKTMALDPLADKWRAFGWQVKELDGHDPDQLLDAFETTPWRQGSPNCIIAHTHKGQGVSFMTDQAAWHHRIPTEQELLQALEELGGSQ